MREDDGCAAGIQCVVHGGGRRVRQVNNDAESIHFFDHQLCAYRYERKKNKKRKIRNVDNRMETENLSSSFTQSSASISSAQRANDGAQIAQKEETDLRVE